MTITELIENLTKDEKVYVSVQNGEIFVKSGADMVVFTLPVKATSFNDFTFVKQIPADFFGKKTGDYVANQIEEYLQTPIDDRGLGNENDNEKVVIKIRQELSDIGEKVYRLEQFGRTKKYSCLSKDYKLLLGFQRKIMLLYMDILLERIHSLEGENEDQ